MVTDNKDHMTAMFGTINESFRAGIDAGRKAQQAWLDNMGEAFRPMRGFELPFCRPERLVSEWGPFVARQAECMVGCFEANSRSGMKVVKTACEVASATGEADPYERTRSIWDASIDAARAGFEAFGAAGKSTLDNVTALCDSVMVEPPKGKTTAKSGK